MHIYIHTIQSDKFYHRKRFIRSNLCKTISYVNFDVYNVYIHTYNLFNLFSISSFIFKGLGLLQITAFFFYCTVRYHINPNQMGVQKKIEIDMDHFSLLLLEI